MPTSDLPRDIRPFSHWSTNHLIFSLVVPHLDRGARIADIGAGKGYFSKKVGDYLQQQGRNPAESLAACDLFPDLFGYEGIHCDAVPPSGILPYADGSFDVVCSLEVIEHLEDQFLFTRELARILKPGGLAIISTPNVLNINSRLRTLRSGFAVLFDPLSLSTTDPVHTSGHIHPVSYYYLAYMLSRAGFSQISARYDRFKNSGKALLGLTGWYVWLGKLGFERRLRERQARVAQENASILAELNSAQMLTSRSIIVVATK